MYTDSCQYTWCKCVWYYSKLYFKKICGLVFLCFLHFTLYELKSIVAEVQNTTGKEKANAKENVETKEKARQKPIWKFDQEACHVCPTEKCGLFYNGEFVVIFSARVSSAVLVVISLSLVTTRGGCWLYLISGCRAKCHFFEGLWGFLTVTCDIAS